MVVLHSKGGFFLEILKVVDLKKHYGDVKAVDGISFTVERGTVFPSLVPTVREKPRPLRYSKVSERKTPGRSTISVRERMS
jgi:ABC-2 type transport system ATP-binding protein